MVGEKDLQLIVCPCVFQLAGLPTLAECQHFLLLLSPRDSGSKSDPLSSAPFAAEPGLDAAARVPPSPKRFPSFRLHRLPPAIYSFCRFSSSCSSSFSLSFLPLNSCRLREHHNLRHTWRRSRVLTHCSHKKTCQQRPCDLFLLNKRAQDCRKDIFFTEDKMRK